jgi:hypothetical protein
MTGQSYLSKLGVGNIVFPGLAECHKTASPHASEKLRNNGEFIGWYWARQSRAAESDIAQTSLAKFFTRNGRDFAPDGAARD